MFRFKCVGNTKPLTLKDFENAVKVLEETKVIPIQEIILYYTSNLIKLGLQNCYFNDVEGDVKCGGYKVFDLNKNDFARTLDYK